METIWLNEKYKAVSFDGEHYLFDDSEGEYCNPVQEVNEYLDSWCKNANTRKRVCKSLKMLYDYLASTGARHPARFVQGDLEGFMNYCLRPKEHRDDSEYIEREPESEVMQKRKNTWVGVFSVIKLFFMRSFPDTSIQWVDPDTVVILDDGRVVAKNNNPIKAKYDEWNAVAPTSNEVKRLIAGANSGRDKLLLRFVYEVGVRSGELHNIHVRQFDVDKMEPLPGEEGYLKIQISESFKPEDYKRTKTGGRLLRIHESLFSKVVQYVKFERSKHKRSEKHDEVFVQRRNGYNPVTGETVSYAGDPLTGKAIEDIVGLSLIHI